MRIAVLSDLHLEFYEPGHLAAGGGPVKPLHAEQIAAAADVVVLAGDIHVGEAGVRWAANLWPATPVIYVLGNHEAYHRSLEGTLAACRAAAKGTSVHVLENEAVTIGGVRFLGTTLWTDFQANGDRPAAEGRVGVALMDYRVIRTGSDERPLTAADTRVRHAAARAWLAEELAQGSAVVVTHHGPHMATQPPPFRFGPLAPGFTSDCTELFGEQVPLWICGHTHYCCDFVEAGTRVVANQAGYPHEPVAGFEPVRLIDTSPGAA